MRASHKQTVPKTFGTSSIFFALSLTAEIRPCNYLAAASVKVALSASDSLKGKSCVTQLAPPSGQ
jgi:hypothetical protein